jgi:hypothetical protein
MLCCFFCFVNTMLLLIINVFFSFLNCIQTYIACKLFYFIFQLFHCCVFCFYAFYLYSSSSCKAFIMLLCVCIFIFLHVYIRFHFVISWYFIVVQLSMNSLFCFLLPICCIVFFWHFCFYQKNCVNLCLIIF